MEQWFGLEKTWFCEIQETDRAFEYHKRARRVRDLDSVRSNKAVKSFVREPEAEMCLSLCMIRGSLCIIKL